jgi:mono/diheme cytochrome c family protein
MTKMTTRIFIGLLVFAALLALVIGIGVGETERMETFDGAFHARSIENGAALFQSNCEGCHGIQGQGITGVAPALNSYDFFVNRLDEIGYAGSLESYIAGTVAAGRPVKSANWPAPMPTWGQAYGGPLREDQIEDLTAFVLNWQGAAVAAGPPVTPTPGEVSEDPVERGMNDFVSKGCSGCHTIEGLEGAVGQVGPELTHVATHAATRVEGQTAGEYIRNSILNPGAYLVQECPTGACANVMPPNFGELLTSQEIDDLVTYLLTLE